MGYKYVMELFIPLGNENAHILSHVNHGPYHVFSREKESLIPLTTGYSEKPV